MECSQTALEEQLQLAKSEVRKLQEELSLTGTKFKSAQTQIDQLNKEKGVAMRDNATSYQQSIQLESQVCIVYTTVHNYS